MTIPGWAVAVIVTVMLTALTALVQLSVFLGQVVQQLRDYRSDISSLRKSRHEHAQTLAEHEVRITHLEEAKF